VGIAKFPMRARPLIGVTAPYHAWAITPRGLHPATVSQRTGIPRRSELSSTLRCVYSYHSIFFTADEAVKEYSSVSGMQQ